MDVEVFKDRMDFSVFDQRISEGVASKLYFFEVWFKTPLLETAIKLANGEDIDQTERHQALAGHFVPSQGG